jgi:hypothetical protein
VKENELDFSDDEEEMLLREKAAIEAEMRALRSPTPTQAQKGPAVSIDDEDDEETVFLKQEIAVRTIERFSLIFVFRRESAQS